MGINVHIKGKQIILAPILYVFVVNNITENTNGKNKNVNKWSGSKYYVCEHEEFF